MFIRATEIAIQIDLEGNASSCVKRKGMRLFSKHIIFTSEIHTILNEYASENASGSYSRDKNLGLLTPFFKWFDD